MKREQEIVLHDPTGKLSPLVGKEWIPPKDLIGRTESFYIFKSLPDKKGTIQ